MSSFLRPSVTALGAIAIVLAVASCSADVTVPTALIGSYRLSLYNGAVVPVILSEFTGTSFIGQQSYTCRASFAGALTIQATSTAISSDTLRTTCENGSPDLVQVKSSTGTVSVSGDTITISYPVSGLFDSYRTFALRSGSGILLFRTETDERQVSATGSPLGTKLVIGLRQRLYVPQP